MARHRFQLIATGALLLTATNVAAITAQRTFVSGSGVDNPDCSIVRPCRGFAAALTATTAGGEIIVLDSGGYGRLTITKSISIIAPPGIYAGVSVAAGFDGVTVNAPGATVVLRGLSINGLGGSGNGILVQQAGRIRIEGCVVSNMPASSSRITGTPCGNVGTASSASTPAPRLKIALVGWTRTKSSSGGRQTHAYAGVGGPSGQTAIAASGSASASALRHASAARPGICRRTSTGRRVTPRRGRPRPRPRRRGRRRGSGPPRRRPSPVRRSCAPSSSPRGSRAARRARPCRPP